MLSQIYANCSSFKRVALANTILLQRPTKGRRLPTIGWLHFQLTLLISLLTLTGFVCTNKAHPGEECQSNSNVLCFECDSRYDPNCADPFDFSPTATLDTSSMISMMSILKGNKTTTNETTNSHQEHQDATNSTAAIKRQPKQLPKAVVCHGCCVKITSRMPDGGVYVKRTCTSNLQINYFMVGLVCMKESGDRGKMCFCETDYCNGQTSLHHQTQLLLSILLVTTSLAFVLLWHSPSFSRYRSR